MNAERQQYLDRLYRQYHQEDADKADRLLRWRSIEPESAALLALLVISKQARKVLEIGTSGGYSTLWLADALQSTGGHLTTLDIDAARQQSARQHLQATGLAALVDVRCCDAGDFLRNEAKNYDLILLDAERPAYVDYWPHLADCLPQAGNTLVVDNVLSHAEQVQDFIALVAADKRFRHTTVPVGAGLLLVVRE